MSRVTVPQRAELESGWRVAGATVRAGFKLAFRVRISGADRIPSQGGAILAYNHVSVLDPLFVAVAAYQRGRPVRFLVVADVFEQPVVGRLLRFLRQIPLRRGLGDWQAIQHIAALVRAGALAGLSPEGTVGDGARLGPGQKGAARIALSAQAPVIPVGIWGSQERWPKEGLSLSPPLRPPVGLAVGTPIVATGDPASRPDVRH